MLITGFQYYFRLVDRILLEFSDSDHLLDFGSLILCRSTSTNAKNTNEFSNILFANLLISNLAHFGKRGYREVEISQSSAFEILKF